MLLPCHLEISYIRREYHFQSLMRLTIRLDFFPTYLLFSTYLLCLPRSTYRGRLFLFLGIYRGGLLHECILPHFSVSLFFTLHILDVMNTSSYSKLSNPSQVPWMSFRLTGPYVVNTCARLSPAFCLDEYC